MAIRHTIEKWLRKLVIKFALKKIFGALVGGIKGFIASYILGKLWDRILKPAVLWLGRKVPIWIKRPFRKKKAKALQEAKSEADVDSAVDDLF